MGVPEEDRLGESDKISALGLPWDLTSDSIGVKFELVQKSCTRRGILSMVSQIFDPLGFIQPFLLPAKILLQELSVNGLGWDDEVSEESKVVWKRWSGGLKTLFEISILRCFVPVNLEACSLQLHCFTDASTFGYGAVVYLRAQFGNGEKHCSLVMGRSRVTPAKPVTIPRLELTAAVVGFELVQLVKRELDFAVDSIYFWTDSTSVLHYVRSTARRYKMFVANRIAAIQAGSDPAQWRRVPTAQNPADVASRGALPSQVDECGLGDPIICGVIPTGLPCQRLCLWILILN